jgi:hypothetical protein
MFKSILFTIYILTAFTCLANAGPETKSIIDKDSLLKVYLLKNKFEIDTGAHAIILFEKNIADISVTDPGRVFRMDLSFTTEKCFKIMDKEALDMAEIAIPYSPDFKVKDINIFTVKLENGTLVKTKLLKPDILKEKLVGDVKIFKFNLSNVTPGTIIYYTFTYKMELWKPAFSEYFPINWTFQNIYPVLESVMELRIPAEVNFQEIVKNTTFKNVSTIEDLNKNSHAKLSTVISSDGVTKTNRCFIWRRSNVEALADEKYVTNIDNKQEKVNIYISSFFPDRTRMRTHEIENSWSKANFVDFFANSGLGLPVFTPSDTLSYVLNKIGNGETDNRSLAKKIYKYVRDSIKTTGYSRTARVWLSNNIKTILYHKKGTYADKNILLSALYRKAGLQAYPVVLSTTGHEEISESNFEPDALNHLICVLVIDSSYYYLDASEPFLPFGVLKPESCTSFAWLINQKGAAISIPANTLVEKDVCMATLKPTAKPGIYNLKMEQRMGNIFGPEIREMWKNDSTKTREFLDNDIKTLNYKVKILDWSVANITNPDTPLIISYNLELELDANGEHIYLNPFFKRSVQTNPFKSINRKLPVEFPNALSTQFILKFTLPDGYTLEDADANAKFDFKNNSMSYSSSMLYDPNQKIFSLNNTLLSKVTKVEVEDYAALRSFYESVVQDQNKTIVLKKIK